MCKSPADPGGPYRCSADMERTMNGTQSRWMAARETLTQARADADAALAAFDASAAAVEANTDPALDPVLRAGRDAMGKKSVKAHSDAVAAAAATARAEHSYRVSRADYDATPRGLAEVGRGIATEEEAGRGDSERAHLLRARRDSALARMNAEGRERDAQWGSHSGTRTPLEPFGEPGVDPAAREVMSRAHIVGHGASGHLVDTGRLDAQGNRMVDVKLNNTFPVGDTGDRENVAVSFSLRVPDDGSAITQERVLRQMGERAQSVEGTTSVGDWAEKNGHQYGVSPAQNALLREEYDESLRAAKNLDTLFKREAGWVTAPVRS